MITGKIRLYKDNVNIKNYFPLAVDIGDWSPRDEVQNVMRCQTVRLQQEAKQKGHSSVLKSIHREHEVMKIELWQISLPRCVSFKVYCPSGYNVFVTCLQLLICYFD